MMNLRKLYNAVFINEMPSRFWNPIRYVLWGIIVVFSLVIYESYLVNDPMAVALYVGVVVYGVSIVLNVEHLMKHHKKEAVQ